MNIEIKSPFRENEITKFGLTKWKEVIPQAIVKSIITYIAKLFN